MENYAKVKNLSSQGCVLGSRTASWAPAVDGGHPEVRRAGVKDDLKGLGRSSNGDDSKVGQLETRRRWPGLISQTAIHRSVPDLTAATHVSIVGHGLLGDDEAAVELAHGVVWVPFHDLLPETLLLQALPGRLTLLQRDPGIHQREQFLFQLQF